jgi:DNA-binding MarR family transcriptional regulator
MSTKARCRNILNPGLDSPLTSRRMDELIGYHVRRVQIVLMQQFERMADSQITPAILHMLLLIEENPGVSMSTIASEHGVDRASLVPAIQRMESKGWIERSLSPDDKRVLMLRCTQTGSEQAKAMLAKVYALEADLLAGLTAKEQKQLLSLLQRVARRPHVRKRDAAGGSGGARRRAPNRAPDLEVDVGRQPD